MKVMYDITLLSIVMAQGWRCTGICRVTKELLAALAIMDGLEISPYLGDDAQLAKGSLSAIDGMSLPLSYPIGIRLLDRIGGAFPVAGRGSVTGFRRPLRDMDVAVLYREFKIRTRYWSDSRINRWAQAYHANELESVSVFHDMSFPQPNPAVNSLGLPSLRSIPTLITIYDLIPMLYPQYFGEGSSEHFAGQVARLRSDHHIMCSSEDTRQALIDEAGLEPDQIHLVAWAASQRLFHPCTDSSKVTAVKSRYQIPGGSYILSICTFEPRKNIPHLIDCFVELVESESIDDLSLVLVGGSGWIPQLNEQIAQSMSRHHASGRRIIATGYVPDEDLAPLYSGAMMFVYPSLVEGFGLPPLEAMQCGIPVITSNSSSLPEVVGEAGILVEPDDSDALIQAMLNLYRSSQLRSTLSELALARSAQFSWRRCAEETAAVYRRIT